MNIKPASFEILRPTGSGGSMKNRIIKLNGKKSSQVIMSIMIHFSVSFIFIIKSNVFFESKESAKIVPL